MKREYIAPEVETFKTLSESLICLSETLDSKILEDLSEVTELPSEVVSGNLFKNDGTPVFEDLW